jgi:hypothetical protein
MNTDTRITNYLGFTIWAVLNDDEPSTVDYYDIHMRGDQHGEGDPIACFTTRPECAAWIRKEARDAKLDLLYLGYDRYERFN